MEISFSPNLHTQAIVLTFSFASIADKQTIKSLMAKLNMGESMYGSITLSIKQLITQRGPSTLKRKKNHKINAYVTKIIVTLR